MSNYSTMRIYDSHSGEVTEGTINIDEQAVTVAIPLESVVAKYVDTFAVSYTNAKCQDLCSKIQDMINARLDQERKRIFAIIEEHTSINLTQSEFLELLK